MFTSIFVYSIVRIPSSTQLEKQDEDMTEKSEPSTTAVKQKDEKNVKKGKKGKDKEEAKGVQRGARKRKHEETVESEVVKTEVVDEPIPQEQEERDEAEVDPVQREEASPLEEDNEIHSEATELHESTLTGTPDEGIAEDEFQITGEEQKEDNEGDIDQIAEGEPEETGTATKPKDKGKKGKRKETGKKKAAAPHKGSGKGGRKSPETCKLFTYYRNSKTINIVSCVIWL